MQRVRQTDSQTHARCYIAKQVAHRKIYYVCAFCAKKDRRRVYEEAYIEVTVTVINRKGKH